MKYLFIFSFFVSTLLSASINESLLKIHATIVPKISLMDYDFEKKLVNNEIIIAIYYEKTETKEALWLKENILSKYKDGIKGYKLKCHLIKYDEQKNQSANIIYLFPTNTKKILKTTQLVKEYKSLTFSYSQDDLKNNVMISVNIASNVKPIINLDAIKDNNVTLRPILLKISQRYENENKL